MFYEWVCKGAEIGIVAFFAVFTFMVFAGSMLAVSAVIMRLAGGGRMEDGIHRD